MIPTSIIRVWFLGLFSWILLGLGIYLSHKWYQRAWSYDFNLHRSYFDPHIGNNHETFLLAVAVGLLLWALAGGDNQIARCRSGTITGRSSPRKRLAIFVVRTGLV